MKKIAENGSAIAASPIQVSIPAPNMATAVFLIRGTSPYVQNKFSAKAKQKMIEKQKAGHTAKKGSAREAKNFEAAFKECQHISADGYVGMPASGFRAALVSACRIVGFKMTLAKLSLFILADGIDAEDGTPLVKITKGTSRRVEHHVRNESGVVDIRPRAMWDPGWEAMLRIQYDADQFTLADVSNLLSRVGLQVGIGEGRADSKSSCGMGWGSFEIAKREE